MRRDAEQALTLMCLLSWIPHSMCHSPPGRPRLTKCRSPEKETFTCWWEPGSTGGLATSYHLYYRKESSVEVFECPDYHKAGNNSCHFDKRHTSIWIIYNITVVASNTLGKAYSESVEVDVMDIDEKPLGLGSKNIFICVLKMNEGLAGWNLQNLQGWNILLIDFYYNVQPHPPENVNVTLMQTKNSPYFLVQWQPPHGADTRSGWVTIKYEVRLKMENSRDEEDRSNWESYDAGKQLEFSIYSPQPGAKYVVQVRCKLDQSLWSEWSPSAFIQIPDNMSDTQNAVMILAIALAVIIFLLTAGAMTVKMKRVKRFLLPTIPEPKISGLDTRLLKSGKSEEIFSALVTLGYPQIAQSSDRQVEYLMVSDYDEEAESDSGAHLKYHKRENCSTDAAQNSIPVAWNSNQGMNTTLSEQARPETVSMLSVVLDDRPQRLQLDSQSSPVKAQDQIFQMISDRKCEHVSITPAGCTGYVEVDEKKRDQKPLVGEDYSMVSDVISDNILVLQDSIPVQGHKEVKCDKTSGAEETGGVVESVTTFSSGS